MDTLSKEAPPVRRTLTASPAMLAAAQRRRAAIEAPPAPVPKAKPEAPKPDPAPVAVEAPKADRKPRWRAHPRRWVVQCDCGFYEYRKTTAIHKAIKRGVSQSRDCCDRCHDLEGEASSARN